MGAFGLNKSVLDVANLSWKLGLAAKGLAKLEKLLPTYTTERRKHAVKIIQVSGEYLRFICGSTLSVPDLGDPAAMDRDDKSNDERTSASLQSNGGRQTDPNGNGCETCLSPTAPSRTEDMDFISKFFRTNGQFLLGVDCPYDSSLISLPARYDEVGEQQVEASRRPRQQEIRPAINVHNGVRAPNPRVCFSTNETGYLYDKLAGGHFFHLLIFASSLEGTEVRRQMQRLTESFTSSSGFYQRFGGARLFQAVIVVKLLPFEFEGAKCSVLQSLLRLENNKGRGI